MSFGKAPYRSKLDQPGGITGEIIDERFIEERRLGNIEALRREVGDRIASEGLRSVFSSFDTDNSGAISRGELKKALSDMGIQTAKSDLDYYMGVMDADGGGGISMDEFVAFFESDLNGERLQAWDDAAAK